MYKFIEEFKCYFKRSDLDFGIYINPNFNLDISNEISIISYKIQLLITEILLKNKNICFKWFKYEEKYQQEILRKILGNINNARCFKNKESIYYNNKLTNIQFIDNCAFETKNNYISSQF